MILTRFLRTFLRFHKSVRYKLHLLSPDRNFRLEALSYSQLLERSPVKPSLLRRRVLLWTLFLFLMVNLIPAPAIGAQHPVISQQKPPLANSYYFNPPREFQLLKKVLSFERTWKARAGQELVIGILYQKSSSISSWIMEDWLNFSAQMSEIERKLEGVSIIFQKIELDSASSLETSLVQNRVQILYITPLDNKKTGRTLKEIVDLCRKLKIGTFTAVPEYVDSGIAIGFQLKDEKPQISINLDASRAQGFDFSSQLLRLAKIRGKNG